MHRIVHVCFLGAVVIKLYSTSWSDWSNGFDAQRPSPGPAKFHTTNFSLHFLHRAFLEGQASLYDVIKGNPPCSSLCKSASSVKHGACSPDTLWSSSGPDGTCRIFGTYPCFLRRPCLRNPAEESVTPSADSMRQTQRRLSTDALLNGATDAQKGRSSPHQVQADQANLGRMRSDLFANVD